MEKKVYKVEEIQNLLGLGRSKAYEFIENVYYDRKPFRVLKIGRSYRIPCNSFDKWLNGDEERDQFTEENKKDRVSCPENWREENIDTSAGASVNWGKQGDTDSYADFICGIDGT